MFPSQHVCVRYGENVLEIIIHQDLFKYHSFLERKKQIKNVSKMEVIMSNH